MADFATVNDVISLWRSLTAEEQSLVSTLLPIVSKELRYKANQRGRDLDEMIDEDADLELICKAVTVDVIKRYINDNTDSPTFSQVTESALGYSQTGTYLVPGGGIFIKESDLKRLGLKRQRLGVIDLC